MRRGLCLCAVVAFFCAALPPAPGQAAARRAIYHGETAQKRNLRLRITPGAITLIRFDVKMLCRDGSLLYGDASGFETTRLKRSGRFADVQYGSTDVVSWKGRVRGHRVTGTVRVEDRLKIGVRCDSGPVRFAAKRA
jgi:hypothetical protein